jgi:hypothetical protein
MLPKTGRIFASALEGKLAMDDEEYFWHAGMIKHWGDEKGKVHGR